MSSNQTISEFIRAQDFCESVFDGTHDSPKKTEIGRKLVTSKHLKGNQILLEEAYLISEEDFEKISARSSVAKHDLLFSMIGTVGEVVVLDFDPDFAVKNLGVLRAKNETDAYWLYYYLRSSLGRENVQQAKQGSTQQFIPLGGLRNFPVPVSGDSQFRHRQVSILRKIDEKIQLNQQIASTLEQIAQTIFRSWFVNFDPVHAKARGEQPVGMDAETAALFPDSFEDSEFGPIPSGWNVKEVGQVLSLVGGSTPSTANSDYWDGIYTWTTPKDLSNQKGLITIDSARKITDLGLAKITSGLLERGSVLMSSRAPIGYLAIADVPTAINQGFIAFPSTKDFHPMYILNWLSSNMDEIKNRSGGSSFAEVSKSAFKTLPMLVPKSEIVQKFSEVAQPILEQLSQITYQNRTLQDLRDSLLPRLISGELKIPAELVEA